MASRDAPDLCLPCMSLVGAGPGVAPHAQLARVASAAEMLFRCATCDASWSMQTLGWGRLDA